MSPSATLRNCLRILSRIGAARLAMACAFLSVAVFAGSSYATEGVAYALLSHDLTAAEKITRIQEFFATLGAAAPLAYVAMVTVEVVLAPLPGAMLYAPGGIIFGGFWGGLLSLTGNVLGAGLACQIMRTFGRPYIERALDRGSLRKYEDAACPGNGIWVVFLLQVKSADLVRFRLVCGRSDDHASLETHVGHVSRNGASLLGPGIPRRRNSDRLSQADLPAPGRLCPIYDRRRARGRQDDEAGRTRNRGMNYDPYRTMFSLFELCKSWQSAYVPPPPPPPPPPPDRFFGGRGTARQARRRFKSFD